MTQEAPRLSYTVSVRELCEFTAKQGDLDLRFTPAPTALEGIAGHGKVSARRGAGYEREVAVEGLHGLLRVRGRADGYNPALNELDEIKTYRGALQRMPANHRALHWAQLKLYGAMLCRQRGLADIKLSLVYFDIVRERETLISESCSAEDLLAFFDEHCARFLAWAQQETAHRAARRQALAAIRFPYGEFHAGQRTLAEAVYRGARDGGCLMAQAPTGIGKTVGTLFPLLKACATQPIDRVFFLTAKTPGRQLALDALQRIQDAPLADDAPAPGRRPLRVLEMVAREKSCEHPDKACHGESCPLAKGFYDRLPAARAAAIASDAPLDQPTVRRLALDQQICPYYLSQELARWADVVVGDYNYYFDGSALLFSLMLANEWKAAVLVDEAHNLLERGRGMYSAELDQAHLAAVRRGAPKALKGPLDRLNREWNRIHRDQEAEYQAYAALPGKFVEALGKLTTAITDHLSEQPDSVDPRLQSFYFECLQFRAMAEVFAPHSIFDVSLQRVSARQTSTLCLRNVIPAPFLSERIQAAQSTTLFSATLSPATFYQDLLGLPETTLTLDVPSPFTADQLRVRLVDSVSTRFQDRADSLAPIAALMARQYRERPGNYLAFFSSFDYLQDVARVLESREPDIRVWKQSRGMSEADRALFLGRFTLDSQGIGFAVLGGAFAEGIDLPGSRLIGAFVATLGLPQLNPVNEQIKDRIEAIFGRGYDYTYLYPGLQKVVQAAGRVIRQRSDEGVLYLIDDRFNRRSVRGLLPSWWDVKPMV